MQPAILTFPYFYYILYYIVFLSDYHKKSRANRTKKEIGNFFCFIYLRELKLGCHYEYSDIFLIRIIFRVGT